MRHICKYGCNPNTYKILGNDGFYDCPIHGGIDKKVEDYVSILKDENLFKKYNIPMQYKIDLTTYKTKNGVLDSLNTYTGSNTLTDTSKAVKMVKNRVTGDCSKKGNLSEDLDGFFLDIVYLDHSKIDVYAWAYTLLQIAVLEGVSTNPIKTIGWLSELKNGRNVHNESYMDYVMSDLCIVKINRVMNKQNIYFLQDFIMDRFFEGKGVVLLSDLSKEELESSKWFDFIFKENKNLISDINYVGLVPEEVVVKPVKLGVKRSTQAENPFMVEDIFRLTDDYDVNGILDD